MRRIPGILLPIGVLLGSVGVTGLLLHRAGAARQVERDRPVQAVRVVEAIPAPATPRVRGSGVVEAAREVRLQALVTGPVVWMNEALRPGGRIRRGEALLRVDDRPYRAAVAQEAARLEQAELELALERQRAALAGEEVALVQPDRRPTGLALRQPQLAAAQHAAEAARAALSRAELDLERTVLRAPFDAVVVSESVDVGQVVAPGAALARLVGTRRARVQVAVPPERLPLVALDGGEASLRPVGGEGSWQGRTAGLVGELDPGARQARVLVLVDAPFEPAATGSPLLPGTFVEVDLAGPERAEVVLLPEAALHDGVVVWMVDADDTLRRREVRVGWNDGGRVAVLEGLAAGDRVVVSPLVAPVDGLAVRVVEGT